LILENKGGRIKLKEKTREDKEIGTSKSGFGQEGIFFALN
jgi:hypothetical protein